MEVDIKEAINIDLTMNHAQYKKIANEFDKLYIELVKNNTVADYEELWLLKGVFNRV